MSVFTKLACKANWTWPSLERSDCSKNDFCQLSRLFLTALLCWQGTSMCNQTSPDNIIFCLIFGSDKKEVTCNKNVQCSSLASRGCSTEWHFEAGLTMVNLGAHLCSISSHYNKNMSGWSEGASFCFGCFICPLVQAPPTPLRLRGTREAVLSSSPLTICR